MKRYKVEPDAPFALGDHDPKETGDQHRGKGVESRMAQLTEKLDLLQERLYAEGRRAVLIVLQGTDTAGKDGVIRHVMDGLNPQGCVVTSFKSPTPLERSHDFLWRAHAACPPAGSIGIFNRSYYEEVLITRVHGWISDAEAELRLRQIVEFERMLASQGVRILKFFLHLSEGEQKKRLMARLDDPDQRWKFNAQDLQEREHWDAYQKAFAAAIVGTSSQEAPWYVVPSDHKWYRNLVVAERLVHALEGMDPRAPESHRDDWKELRAELEGPG